MTVQLGTTLRNNMIGQYEGAGGASGPFMKFFTGTQPANCAAAATGTELTELDLPTDWMTAASNGSIGKNGVWTANGAVAGIAGYYRLVDTTKATCFEQGSISLTGNGGDLQVDNVNVGVGQPVTITAWNRTQAGA